MPSAPVVPTAMAASTALLPHRPLIQKMTTISVDAAREHRAAAALHAGAH